MKEPQIHINSILIWLILPFLFFSTCIIANTTGKMDCFVSFSEIEKTIAFSIKNTSEPNRKGLPEKSSTENNLISNPDIEEVTNLLMVKNIIFLNVFHLCFPRRVPINYEETYHMQFHSDIVPPPPKV